MAVDLHHICVLEDRAGLIPSWKQDFVLPPEILDVQVEPARWMHPQEQFLACCRESQLLLQWLIFLFDRCLYPVQSLNLSFGKRC